MKNWLEIFLISLKLGFTSFGGPTAHLGYFQNEYVKKRKWLSDEQYADLVALCQFLPGPASSQVGMGIGLLRGGIIGSIIAFLGFTMPSVIFLMACAYLLSVASFDASWIHGLKLVAVAIVAQAIFDMAKKLIPSWTHRALAVLALIIVLTWQSSITQIVVILLAALIGNIMLKQTKAPTHMKRFPISKKVGSSLLVIFFSLLVLLPILGRVTENNAIILFEKFYTAGSFVFGGGHVVLPLLETQFVQSGLVSASDFLTGYGLTQAVPGPLFTFAAYIGTVVSGIPGGLLATLAIFLPAFLLVMGVLPFWQQLSTKPTLRGAVSGMNAAVVGILAAAFVTPIVTSTVHTILDGIFAILLFLLLTKAKLPPWIVVVTGLVIGLVMY